jgi:hypothetical protein
MTRPDPLRLHATRRIDADPTSTALLLAGPGARELWPAATVAVEPPHRTPTGFVARFTWSGPDLPRASGVLRLTPAPGGHGTPSTSADLTVVVPEPPDGAGSGVLDAFLQALAHAAQDRRQAA